MSKPEERWQQRAKSHLVGRLITAARYLTDSNPFSNRLADRQSVAI